MRNEQDEIELEAELGTRSHVWIAALSDKLPPCPSRAGASPAALVPAKCMYKRQTEGVTVRRKGDAAFNVMKLKGTQVNRPLAL